MKDRKSSSLPTSDDLESHELLMTLIVESFGSLSKQAGEAVQIPSEMLKFHPHRASDLSSNYHRFIQTFSICR